MFVGLGFEEHVGEADDAGAGGFEFGGNFAEEFALDAGSSFGGFAGGLGFGEEAHLLGEALFVDGDANDVAPGAPWENVPAQEFGGTVGLDVDVLFVDEMGSAVEGATNEVFKAIADFGKEIEDVAAVDVVPGAVMEIEPTGAGECAFAFAIDEGDRDGGGAEDVAQHFFAGFEFLEEKMAGGDFFEGADVALGDVVEEDFATADAREVRLLAFAGEADFHGEIGAATHGFLEFGVEGAAFGGGESVEPAVAEAFSGGDASDLTKGFVDVGAEAVGVGEEHAKGGGIGNGAEAAFDGAFGGLIGFGDLGGSDSETGGDVFEVANGGDGEVDAHGGAVFAEPGPFAGFGADAAGVFEDGVGTLSDGADEAGEVLAVIAKFAVEEKRSDHALREFVGGVAGEEFDVAIGEKDFAELVGGEDADGNGEVEESFVLEVGVAPAVLGFAEFGDVDDVGDEMGWFVVGAANECDVERAPDGFAGAMEKAFFGAAGRDFAGGHFANEREAGMKVVRMNEVVGIGFEDFVAVVAEGGAES